MENETVKLLQGMNIQSDNILEHAKPDNIVLVKTQELEGLLIWPAYSTRD